MARGAKGKGKSPRTETPAAPSQHSQPSLPLPSSPPSDITMPIPLSTISQDCTDTGSQFSPLTLLEVGVLDTSESSASTGPNSVKTGVSDPQYAQDLNNPSFLDGEKPPTQVTENRERSAKSEKRGKRKVKKDKATEQSSPTPVVSPDILPLDYSGPMPAPKTLRGGSSIPSSKPKVDSPPISPFLAFAEPTKAEIALRQENEKLRRELNEANCLAKGLKEAHLQLEVEVEAWKQKCEGFSEAVEELKIEVEGMINSRISKFFDQMKEEKKEEEDEKERKKEEEKVKERQEKEKEEEEEEEKEKEEEEKGEKEKEKVKEKKEKVKEKKEKKKKEKGKTKKEKEEKRVNKKKGRGEEGKEEEGVKNGEGDTDGKEGEGTTKEAELKAREAKNRQSSFEQIRAYRQRKKEEERQRKKWWSRRHIKFSRTFWRRVVMALFILGLITLLLAPFVIIAIGEIQAYSRAHARRIKRLKLRESRNVQLAKAVAQFAADLSPEPIRGILYHSFLNDGWDLDEPY